MPPPPPPYRKHWEKEPDGAALYQPCGYHPARSGLLVGVCELVHRAHLEIGVAVSGAPMGRPALPRQGPASDREIAAGGRLAGHVGLVFHIAALGMRKTGAPVYVRPPHSQPVTPDKKYWPPPPCALPFSEPPQPGSVRDKNSHKLAVTAA
eukprot:scaffold76522_cov63-Phaeocystis_antarctica.AAC.2